MVDVKYMPLWVHQLVRWVDRGDERVRQLRCQRDDARAERDYFRDQRDKLLAIIRRSGG